MKIITFCDVDQHLAGASERSTDVLKDVSQAISVQSALIESKHSMKSTRKGRYFC